MEITYAGGPIVNSPRVYTGFWGPAWNEASHQDRAAHLIEFHQDLLNSTFMNVLTQYGILGPGAGAFVENDVVTWVHDTLTVAEYQQIIQDRINARALPEPQTPALNILMLFLDENTIINDPANNRQLNFAAAYDVGYHDHFVTDAGGSCYYGFIAYSRDIDTTTVVASHEFAEILTDPEYSAWTPDRGMTEIGDVCDGQDRITVGANNWAVQPIWSAVDGRCIAQAPYPTPELQRDPAQQQQAFGALGMKRGTVPGRP